MKEIKSRDWMKIGNIELKNGLVLAPMAGVTDLPFRILCKERGADLVVSEMISAKGMYYKDKKTELLTMTKDKERPIALQIFGSEPDIISQAIKEHLNPRLDFDILDINMGCPAPKIVKNGDGAALMQKPKLAREIMQIAVKASNKPVTVKLRLGWDESSKNIIEIAKQAEEVGISALTLHARTRDMFYSGKADWEYIARVKDKIKIPVIGNGDIFSAQDALNMIKETKCDALALGRGVVGNPWLFEQIISLMKGKEYNMPHNTEKIEMAIRHFKMAIAYKGDKLGLLEMRKHLAWYLKGIPGANEMKNKLNNINDKHIVINELRHFLLTLEDK